MQLRSVSAPKLSIVFVALLGLSACGSDDKTSATTNAICVDSDSRCGRSCDDDDACAAGLYCGSDNVCAKACDTKHACKKGKACSADGECLAVTTDAGMSDANFGNGGGGVGGGSGSTAGSGGDDSDAGNPNVCADVNVAASRVVPTVILVIDQSGSMTTSFGSSTRWNTLRDFLLKKDGLIDALQNKVRFGLAMYSARSSADNAAMAVGECPLVDSVAPTLGNYTAIQKKYSAAEPIQETPTGDAIDKIVSTLDTSNEPDQEAIGPTVLVLATDGEPDTCEMLNPQNGQQEAIDAVTRAFALGIRTFIISVGNEVGAKHQQDVANAGIGHKAGDPNAEFWNASDDTTLRDALTKIVGGQVSCDVKLKGSVAAADACKGTVELNGEKLVCKDKNGWKLTDKSHIQLQGTACETFKNADTALLNVKFPCGVPVLD